MIGILQTGVANVASMTAVFHRLGLDVKVCTVDGDVDETVTHVVLPGVGSFGAVEGLRESGLDQTVLRVVERGTPLLAVCLGLQMLCEESEEQPGIPGLAIVPGVCQALGGGRSGWPRRDGVVVPHLGWNLVVPEGDGVVGEGAAAFANSYALFEGPVGWTVSWTVHGRPFVAAVEREGILACQFHPELSGAYGLELIRDWVGHGKSRHGIHGIHGKHKRVAAGVSGEGQPVGGLNVVSVRDVRAVDKIRPKEIVAKLSTHKTVGDDPDIPCLQWIPWQSNQWRQWPTLVTSRIIPCLDVCNGRVVKGVQFQELRDVGDPATSATQYESEGADEIVVLDIAAAPDGLAHRTDVVQRIREGVGIPLTVGGGVRSVGDARALLSAGADKVSVNTAAVKNPELVRDMATAFGCQCVVVAIDAKRGGDRWQVRTVGGRETNDLDVVEWAVKCVALGAGEVLLTSWDRDGTRSGYDVELIEAVAANVNVPVIASGGGGTAEDVLVAFRAGAHAVLAASIFHDRDMTVNDLKNFLKQHDVRVRV